MKTRILRLGDEFIRFRKTAARLSPIVDQAINFLLWTGTQPESVESMQWQEISTDLKVWTLPDARTRSGKTCIVPLMKPAQEILRARLQATSDRRWVFASEETESGHVESLTRHWRYASKQTDLPPLQSICMSAGWWLNHESIEDLRQAVASYTNT